MNRLMPCTFPLSFCLAVVAVALALVACGGSMGRESVTSAPVVESASSALDDGTVSESGTAKVAVCHKGANKSVPHGAVVDHLLHGDWPGSCASPAVCPCFSMVESCPGAAVLACDLGDPAQLIVRCDVGGVGNTTLRFYRSETAGGGDGGFCQGDGGLEIEITVTEHFACVAAFASAGCP